MQIDGQVAIVTGGASGLGAATARHLAALGARVGILDFDGDSAKRVAHENGGVAAQVDVSDADAVDAAISRVEQALGTPRIVVNCAGIGLAARIVGRDGQTSFDTFQRTLAVNLFGTYNVMTHAARRMMQAEPVDGERGVIVNTASVAYQDGQVGQAAYAASKGAVAAMSLPAAREFARAGIRVMTIAPGLFHTPMMESLPQEVTDQITANIPHPARLGNPAEYAELAGHIISNPYLNGTTIRLDGATRLPPR
ncbi:SDR family NAD(P)-dependent oxidoreductase [Aliiroseovarius sp.]|uniref:SDR family NAD(P)-dependent oxidoreductase n=1 Tax=Aliiroseovarius sp. TaxID=1872442 RepID=UPI0026246E2C|nr:SDR family NAD(P)-dependent oxidoreductase [Aliiroseovarius sp.]